MKKYLIVLLFCCTPIHFVSADTEAYISLLAAQGNYFGFISNSILPVSGYRFGFGANFTIYGFQASKNAGIYCAITGLGNNLISSGDILDYSSSFMGLVIGPAFRNTVTYKFALLYAAGLDFTAELASYRKKDTVLTKHNLNAVNLGVGGNLALRLDITSVIHFATGMTVNYDFINWTNIESDAAEAKRNLDLTSSINIIPYIGIGINTYYTGSGFGKRPPA